MNADTDAETQTGMSFEKYKELSQTVSKVFDGVHLSDVIRVFAVIMAAHTVKGVSTEDELIEVADELANEIAVTYRDSCLALSAHYTKPANATIQ